MVRILISCSITSEQSKFLSENPQISPSKILQDELMRLMETKLNPTFLKEMQDEIKNKEIAIENWRKLFYTLQEFIKNKGFEEESSKILANL